MITNPIDREMFNAHYSSVRICDISTDNESNAFSDALYIWRNMIGIKAPMDEMESTICQGFIKSSYGQLTIGQILMAARLSLTGDLGVDANIYDKGFAPLYIGRILTAFVKKNDAMINRLMQEAEKQKKSVPEPRRSAKQKARDVRELVRGYLKKIDSDGKFEIDFKSTAYRVICTSGFSPSGDLEQDYLEQATRDFDEFAQNNSLNKVLLDHIRSDSDNRIKSYMEFRHNLAFVRTLDDIDAWVDSLPDETLWQGQEGGEK